MSVISDNLRDRVGALLDVRISDATVPSRDQVNEWMYEGAFILCKLLPISILGTMMDTFTEDTASDWDVGDQDIVRVVSIVKDSNRCRIYSYPDFLRVLEDMPALHGSGHPACSFTGIAGGQSVIKFFPDETNTAFLTFVTSPAPVEEWEVTTSPHLIPPDTWAELIVEYATMKGKVQDEEEEAATMLYQMWMQSVQAFGQQEVVGTDAE